LSLVDGLLVVIFIIGIMGIGSFFYRWIGRPDDFYVAGRELTPFILAATLTATNMNLYNFIGEAGQTAHHGISLIWHEWTGNMALVFSGLFVIPILRRLRVRTIPEYLEHRYGTGMRALVGGLWIIRISFWLGVVLYTAVRAAQGITGHQSFTLWILVFSALAVVYTMLGGMWSVAITDVLQFLLMLAGSLITVPIVMSAVGWLPGLMEKIPSSFFNVVSQTGPFNWQFTLAIFVLGLEWACVDQGMLQTSFGARSTRTVAKGMVLAGIILTPFNILIFLPGLTAAYLLPNISNPDLIIPRLLVTYLPMGALGLVMCGLLASQLSTIITNINGVSTLFTNDIYSRLLRKDAPPKQVLRMARLMVGVAGVLMIIFAYMVPRMGGAVYAYLDIISVMDMPLFVVAIIYGLLWRRATQSGALIAYFVGAIAGATALWGFDLGFNVTTFISAGATLVACPIASLLFGKPDQAKVAAIWRAKQISDEEVKSGEYYHILPKTGPGKLSLAIWFTGLLVFIGGAILGAWDPVKASIVAVCGMLIYFTGGFLRLKFD